MDNATKSVIKAYYTLIKRPSGLKFSFMPAKFEYSKPRGQIIVFSQSATDLIDYALFRLILRQSDVTSVDLL